MLVALKKFFFNLMIGGVFLLWGVSARAEIVEYDGLIEPYEVIEIGAPSEGIVTQVKVDRSSQIKKGQILVALEPSLEQAAFEKARAMAAFDGEIKLQQTQLSFAKRVYQRIKPLAVISANDKDQAATKIILTDFRLKKAWENNILAKLELKKARAMLARRSVKSPISGVVVDCYVSPGEYVKSQPLLKVAQINPLRVEVIIPARMFGRIIPGMTATIVPELTAYGEHLATVRIVDRIIDSASNTFGVRLELPNKKHLLPAGLKCLVRFEVNGTVDDGTIDNGKKDKKAKGNKTIYGVKKRTATVALGQIQN
jgi:RND family efflux transporter MFP subunit